MFLFRVWKQSFFSPFLFFQRRRCCGVMYLDKTKLYNYSHYNMLDCIYRTLNSVQITQSREVVLSLTCSVCENGCVDVICEDVDNILCLLEKKILLYKYPYFAITQS